MARKKKTWLKVGAGLGIVALGAWGIRKFLLSRLSDDLELPAGTLEAGNNVLPIEPVSGKLPTYIASFKAATNVPPPPSQQLFANVGQLEIEVEAPRCRILYDDQHWKGSRFASIFDDGEIISYEQGNRIMWMEALDGPPVGIKNEDGSILAKVRYPKSVYVRSYVGSKDEVFAGLPYPAGSSWDDNFDLTLRSAGFRRVPMGWSAGRRVGTIALPPGEYTVIVEPGNIWTEADWTYIKGFWEWTDEGPRSKSCSTLLNRIKDQIKHVPPNCEKLSTKFDRVACTIQFRDLMTSSSGSSPARVTVTKDKKSSIKMRPITTIQVSNRKYKSTTLSRAYYACCAAMVALDYNLKLGGSAISFDKILTMVQSMAGILGECK